MCDNWLLKTLPQAIMNMSNNISQMFLSKLDMLGQDVADAVVSPLKDVPNNISRMTMTHMRTY